MIPKSLNKWIKNTFYTADNSGNINFSNQILTVME